MEQLFCWEKDEDDSEAEKISCINVCGVSRKDDGKLEQGCWEEECSPDDASTESCKTCGQNYCNEEKLVDITCWENNRKTCFTSYNGVCFNERLKTNEVLYGCGNCPTKACKECKGNLCNDGNNFPYFCLDSDGKSVKECSTNECFIDKDSNAGCGGEHNKNIQTALCNTPLCNTKELFDKTLFCLEKAKDESTSKKMTTPCKNECGVVRSLNGELEQGCLDCNNKEESCKTCKTNYCNEEKHVDITCWKSNRKTCFTSYNGVCFVERLKTNEVLYGCGKCSSKTCKECKGNLCNDGDNFPYFCLSSNGGVKECSKSECYIDEGSNAGCFGEHNKNIPHVSCDTPLCNTKELFKKTLFCFEKAKDETKSKRGTTKCKNECGVVRSLNGELIQGCLDCNNKEESCKTCKTNYCNEEELVDYKCFESDGKACLTPRNANCFVARPKNNNDKYISGCGSCISKSEECFECNGNKCNDENFAKSKLFTCLSSSGETTRYCAKNINECYYYKGFGVSNSGCGKCMEESFHNSHCVDCKNKNCNTKQNFEATFRCIQNMGEYKDNSRKCHLNKCYISLDFSKTTNEDLALKNYSKAGCGDCPPNDQFCRTCITNICNTLEYYREMHYCWINNKQVIACNRKQYNGYCFYTISINNNEHVYSKQGCGKCSSQSIGCQTCNKQLCNTEKFFNQKHYCLSKQLNGIKECEQPGCYILKLNKTEYKYDCGKCPIASSNKNLKEININTSPCAECKNIQLCNTKKFFEKQLFCLEKTENTTKATNGIKVCNDKCFVHRNRNNGKVKQGCGSCPNKTQPNECTNCSKNYCNEEKLVHIHCLLNKKQTCTTPFGNSCYSLRTPTNKVSKGCGHCPFFTCKECIGHRCNVGEPPFYCLGVSAKNKECKDNNCYIAKIEEENEDNKVEQYHYNCGKCPSGIYDLSYIITTNNLFLVNKLKKINMTNVQCAQCNNSPNCNSDSFFKHQMFCWEKDVNEWEAKKGNRVCEKETCFVGVEEMGLVQGCGKCSDVQNLTKCNNCSTFLCNNETILPKPIKCFHLNPHFQSYKMREKKCDYVFQSCYIARDVFGRGF